LAKIAEIMRKLLLSLIVFITITNINAQNGQIQNGGFEDWFNDSLFNYTTSWQSSNSEQYYGEATVFQSTDAFAGSYSAELISTNIGSDTIAGYVYHGINSPNGDFGGIPYTDVFNEIQYHYKSNLGIGDTLYVLVVRFAVGAILDINILPAAIGNHSGWTQGSVMIPSGVQNQIFVGFFLSDPINGFTSGPGAWAKIDNVKMLNAGGFVTDLPDQGFEMWATQTMQAATGWSTLNKYLVTAGAQNSIQTIDSHSGNYAIQLSTIQIPENTDTIPGIISLGEIDLSNQQNPFLAAPYNFIPTNLSGAYKYSPTNGDEGSIQVYFFQQGIPIGSHLETFNSSATYSTFSSPISMFGTPDSIIFIASSGNNPGSILKLDDLYFSGGSIGINEFEKFTVSIYPNPAHENVMIKADSEFNYQLIDLRGNIIRSENNVQGAHSINIMDIEAGSYLIRLSNNKETTVHSLVID
jgi:hypothetical protein